VFVDGAPSIHQQIPPQQGSRKIYRVQGGSKDMAPKFQNKKLWLNPNLLFIETENEAILIDVAKKKHYYPNETASIMLNLLVPNEEGPIHFDDMKNHLLKKYAIDVGKAENAIDNFCEHLEKNGLLSSAATDARGTGDIYPHIQKKKIDKDNWHDPAVRTGVNSGILGYAIVHYRP
jgi:Coenzyme PQQ synthesis protein D (PqqD)